MVSIVIATYNRASKLPRAIDSVRRQTHSDWELIIVDDGSTDQTTEIIAALDDSRIRTYRHAKNRGVTAAKNTGLDHIRGKWFTLLDSDDEMMPHALAVMLGCAERNGANAITCNCLDSVTGRMTGVGLSRDGRVSPKDMAKCRGEHWGVTQSSLLGDLRFDERLPGLEDTVWLRVNRIARRYYLHRALRIYHTEGEDRVSLADSRLGIRDKVAIFATIGEHREYLRELRATNPRGYLHTMTRVWTSRLVRPVLGGPAHRRGGDDNG